MQELAERQADETQQGVKGSGQRVARTYTEQELEPFLGVFEVLIEPASLARAPMGRSLGQNAGLPARDLRRAPQRSRRDLH